MEEKKLIIPSIINFVRYYQHFMYWCDALGYINPILYKDDAPRYAGVVFVLLSRKIYKRTQNTLNDTSEEEEKHNKRARKSQKYTFKEFTSGLSKYITCKFKITLLEDMPEDFIQRFKSPRTWGIRVTREMSPQKLERELVNLFGQTWVYGSEPWIVEEKERLSKKIAKTKKRLENALFQATSYRKFDSAICHILEKKPEMTVTTLDIQEIYFSDALWLRLNKFISQPSTLQHLSLKASNTLLAMHTTQFLYALCENTQLLSLRLCQTDGMEIVPRVLQEMIKKNISLQALYLRLCNTGYPAYQLFHDSLAYNHTLTSLHLKFTYLEKNEWENLLEGLHRNRSIGDLNLTCTSPPTPILAKIILLIERPEKPLRSLNLSRNTIPKPVAHLLSAALQKNPVLKKLKLKSCRISTKGLKSIFRALWKNTHLKTLKINLTIQQHSSMVPLKELFQQNNVISHLGLSSYHVDTREFLYWLLTTYSTLVKLDLKGHLHESWDLGNIFSALSQNSRLSSLALENRFLDKEWKRESASLAEKLKKNFCFTTLKFRDFKPIQGYIAPLLSIIERNREIHRQNRKLFIYRLLWLELKIPEWKKFPVDLKLYFLNSMEFDEKSVGKNKEQIRQCVKFITAEHKKCLELITKKQSIILFEKREKRELARFYSFRFFSVRESSMNPIGIKIKPDIPLHISRLISPKIPL